LATKVHAANPEASADELAKLLDQAFNAAECNGFSSEDILKMSKSLIAGEGITIRPNIVIR